MKKSVIFLLHIGFWLCYLLLIAILLIMVFKDKSGDSRIGSFTLTLFDFAVIPSVITFYTFYFILFPKYLFHKRIVASFVYGSIIVLAAALLGQALLYIMGGAAWDIGKNDVSYVGQFVVMAFIATVSGIVALVIKGFITWFNEIKLKEVLQQKTHEMEMALIKSQLDPHFLFNTINNIDVLILKDANQASDYLNKLSEILRFMLYETKPDRILMSKEIEYIKKYIELQKIRTANQSYVTFSIEGNVGGIIIAPMVFIPFIENAFKHTTNKKLENAIFIHFEINQRSIVFTCKNKYNPAIKGEDNSGGLGNDLIQKRLNLLYPNIHTLEVVKQEGLYTVILTIQNG